MNKITIQSNENVLFNKDFIYKDPQEYPNQYAIEMYKAIDTLENLDTVESLYDYNLQSKLSMLNKINFNYGKISRGIENYCRVQSLEAENDSQPSTNTENQSNSDQKTDENNTPNATDDKKRLHMKDILEKVQQAIVNVFVKIFDWIVNLINKFRYNNKVFEATINTINNATPEEINKVSDDLKTVEFENKNIIDVSKHPQQNVNKYIAQYQTICDVFANAVTSASTDPKDITRLKDFATKLYDFVKGIPDVGNTCPQLQGDGAEGLKQYYQSLKTYCGSTLNYQKMTKSFNKYFGGADTYEGKMTASKIVNNSDPKQIINIIKTESDEIGKLNDSLQKIRDSVKKSTKGVSDIIKKIASDKNLYQEGQSQIQALLSCERALLQLNGVFTGICSNSIKSLNVVKGKLIDFTKKNVKGKDQKNNENQENKPKENKTNEETKEDYMPLFDYSTEQYYNMLEKSLEMQFTKMYLVDETEDYSKEAMDSSNFIVRGISTLIETLKNIWKSIVRIVKSLFHKISEAIQRSRVNRAANKEKDNQIMQFLKKSQQCIDKMTPIINKIEANIHRFEMGIKGGNTKTNFDAINMSRIITIHLKLFVLFEKVIFKAFVDFRKRVLNHSLFIIKQGKIESFTERFCSIGNKFCTFIDKVISQVVHGSGNAFFNVNELEKVTNDSVALIEEVIGKNSVTNILSKKITYTSDEHQNKQIISDIKEVIDNIDEELSNQNTIKNISNYLFGIDPIIGEDELIDDGTSPSLYAATKDYNQSIKDREKIYKDLEQDKINTQNNIDRRKEKLEEYKRRMNNLR